MKLLIVDDSNIIRSRIARATLQSSVRGLDIVGLARNGNEAVDLCSRKSPDLVTMDLTMPGMNGIECIEALLGIAPHLHILVVSALSDKATVIEALKRGAHGFLHKPFTDVRLASALTELMEGLEADHGRYDRQ